MDPLARRSAEPQRWDNALRQTECRSTVRGRPDTPTALHGLSAGKASTAVSSTTFDTTGLLPLPPRY